MSRDQGAGAPAPQSVDAQPAEPLKGWKLNHVRKGPEDGMAEIGYLDPEDDHFSPIVTVDTGLYYQDGQAMPLAVAILGAIADGIARAESAQRVGLTDEQCDRIFHALRVHPASSANMARDAIRAAAGITEGAARE